MEIADETLMKEDNDPTDGEVLKEAGPTPPADYVREFELYLMDIGLRFC